MAEIQPLTALHYDQAVAGPLDRLVAPPYDVIDAPLRARLAGRSPYNVVAIDLPEPTADEPDRYAAAAATLARWRAEGAVVADREPAIWALTQEYVGPDGARRTRRGFLAAVRVEAYGPGRIRPHERTHPGPKEDRLKLTRATRANLSPIFSLYSDPRQQAWRALQPHVEAAPPFAETVDADGTVNRLWRIADRDAIAAVRDAADDAELLIADGHHRYETARAYAEERGGDGPHRYVLMALVALQDPGLTVFPTHRLVSGLRDDPRRRQALEAALRRHFAVEPLPDPRALVPDHADGRVQIGYLDGAARRPCRLTLADPGRVDALLAGRARPYRRLDTAVLEALILKDALGMTDEQIDRRDGLAYARDLDHALDALAAGDADVGFFMGAIPVEQIQAVAAAGEPMPPKSTYFYPKIPTGLVLNPLG